MLRLCGIESRPLLRLCHAARHWKSPIRHQGTALLTHTGTMNTGCAHRLNRCAPLTATLKTPSRNSNLGRHVSASRSPFSSVTRHTSRSVLTPFSPHFTQRNMVRAWPEAGAIARRAGNAADSLAGCERKRTLRAGAASHAVGWRSRARASWPQSRLLWCVAHWGASRRASTSSRCST